MNQTTQPHTSSSTRKVHPLQKVRTFCRTNTVFTVAFCAVLVVLPFADFNSNLLLFVDVKTIVCLFCILGTVGLLFNAGLANLVTWLFGRTFHTLRQIICALVGITMILSMVITNDMALIMMLPLSFAVLIHHRWHRALPFCFIMQNLAANLGGMILPFGNPQNLFLYNYFNIPTDAFLTTMALPFGASVLLIAICCTVMLPLLSGIGSLTSNQDDGGFCGKRCSDSPQAQDGINQPNQGDTTNCENNLTNASLATRKASFKVARGFINKRNFCLGFCLFILTVLAVFRVVPYPLVAIVVIAVLALFDRGALIHIDWLLLCTFMCFFLFAGIVSHIPAIKDILHLVMESAPLLASALTSQIISNVPAAALLSQVTMNWAPLLVGVNIGGAGTLVASLASLITLTRYQAIRATVEEQTGDKPISTGLFAGMLMLYGAMFLLILLGICTITV